jgi:hypothetical protein
MDSGSAAGGVSIENGDFSNGLTGWTATQSGGGATPGQVLSDAGQALFLEGDSFLVTLQQSFVMPIGATRLEFDLVANNPGFDLTDNFIPDAFEATLLDSNGLPAVTTWDVLATSFFNMQEDATVLRDAMEVTWDGTTASVDVSGVAEGEMVTLYFDFIGGDADTLGGVRIDNAVLKCGTVPCGGLPCTVGPMGDLFCHINDGSAQNVCTCDRCVNSVCTHTPIHYGNINCAGPVNQVNLDDILCVLAGFANFSSCPNGDTHPACMGNNVINIDDILAILAAFGGADPCNCPF